MGKKTLSKGYQILFNGRKPYSNIISKFFLKKIKTKIEGSLKIRD